MSPASPVVCCFFCSLFVVVFFFCFLFGFFTPYSPVANVRWRSASDAGYQTSLRLHADEPAPLMLHPSP